MRYLIDTLENLKTISSRVALDQGCDGVITRYWFGWIKHPSRDEYSLMVSEEEQNKLTVDEQGVLKTHQELEVDGWFDYI